MEPVVNEPDKYYPQDDISEAIRHSTLTSLDDNEGKDPWYDPNLHGDFDFDLSVRE